MKKKANRRLSAGEMEIMSLLWEHGPLTLSEAHRRLERTIGYTTMQTRLNRLVEKKLASRSGDRPARYAAAVAPDAVSGPHLDDLVRRVTGGNVVPLVAQLVNERTLTRDEIRELKQLVRDAERRLGVEREEG